MDGARRWLLCAEDLLSATLARDLCDRVVRERAPEEWLRGLWDESLVHTQRAWTGLRPDAWWADRTAVDRRCESEGIIVAVRDPLTGRRVAPHAKAAMAFKSARVAEALSPRPELLVISADTDGERDERLRFSEGLRLADCAVPAVYAEIHRESEAWAVAGFTAQNAWERDALARVTSELGFDPTAQPERLLSDVTGDPRDAKRVARALFEASGGITPHNPRMRACWLETPLETLCERGERAGLADYVSAIERVVFALLLRG
jgi:hypothetical protein